MTDPDNPQRGGDAVPIVLATAQGKRELTPEQARRVHARFAEVRRQAHKYQATTGRRGRLILIDDNLIAAIEAFLEHPNHSDDRAP